MSDNIQKALREVMEAINAHLSPNATEQSPPEEKEAEEKSLLQTLQREALLLQKLVDVLQKYDELSQQDKKLQEQQNQLRLQQKQSLQQLVQLREQLSLEPPNPTSVIQQQVLSQQQNQFWLQRLQSLRQQFEAVQYQVSFLSQLVELSLQTQQVNLQSPPFSGPAAAGSVSGVQPFGTNESSFPVTTSQTRGTNNIPPYVPASVGPFPTGANPQVQEPRFDYGKVNPTVGPQPQQHPFQQQQQGQQWHSDSNVSVGHTDVNEYQRKQLLRQQLLRQQQIRQQPQPNNVSYGQVQGNNIVNRGQGQPNYRQPQPGNNVNVGQPQPTSNSSFRQPVFQQLLQVFRSPNSPIEQKRQVVEILKSNPHLITDCFEGELFRQVKLATNTA